MFIGHFALGFAAKRLEPRLNLAVLVAAAQFADLLWPLLVVAGLEQVRIDPGNTAFTPLDFVSYPYSHSLLMLAVWGALFAWAVRAADRPWRAPLVAGLVVSHWVLDVVTHRPDMPIVPGGGPKLGLGLWNSVAATTIVEVILFAVGAAVYLRWTRARDAIGRWGAWALIAFLGGGYVAAAGGAPPPSVFALEATAIGGAAVLTLWMWWVDRHRESTCPSR